MFNYFDLLVISLICFTMLLLMTSFTQMVKESVTLLITWKPFTITFTKESEIPGDEWKKGYDDNES